MNSEVRVIAAIAIFLCAPPISSTNAADRQLSQAADQPPPTAQHRSIPPTNTNQPSPTGQEHIYVNRANTGDGTPAVVIDDRDAEGILGKSVFSTANEDMGRIVDVIVKRSGEVRAAVIDFGGFLGVGNRKIAVDWSALRFPTSGPMDHIILELTRDQVRLAPEFKPGEPLVVLGSAHDARPNMETSAPGH